MFNIIEAWCVLATYTTLAPVGQTVAGTMFGFMLDVTDHGDGTFTVCHEFPDEGVIRGTAIEAAEFLRQVVAVGDTIDADETIRRLDEWS